MHIIIRCMEFLRLLFMLLHIYMAKFDKTETWLKIFRVNNYPRARQSLANEKKLLKVWTTKYLRISWSSEQTDDFVGNGFFNKIPDQFKELLILEQTKNELENM